MYKKWQAARVATEDNSIAQHAIIEMCRIETLVVATRSASLSDLSIKLLMAKEMDNDTMLDSLLIDVDSFSSLRAAE